MTRFNDDGFHTNGPLNQPKYLLNGTHCNKRSADNYNRIYICVFICNLLWMMLSLDAQIKKYVKQTYYVVLYCEYCEMRMESLSFESLSCVLVIVLELYIKVRIQIKTTHSLSYNYIKYKCRYVMGRKHR